MSLLDLFRGKAKNKPEPPNVPVDLDESGERIYYEDIVEGIKAELEKRRDDRALYELQWTLNANFMAGHQNCDIDVYRRCVRDTERQTKKDRERRVYNRVAPLMETRHANLGSVKYQMVVNPRSPEPDDVEKAKTSTKLLDYCQSVTDFADKMDKLISWAELCGTAFTLSWWDAERGERVGDGVVIRANADGDAVSEPKPIMTGDIAFGLVSPYEVFPQSLTIEDIADQHDIIIERVLDIGEIYDLYGRRYEGEEIDGYVLTPLPNGTSGHGNVYATYGVSKVQRENCERVITYLENPSRKYPRGRLITIIKDEIVYYGDLPAGIMPLTAIKSKPVSGQFFGKSVIQDLIPLQRSYNENYNKIQDFIDTVANNPWLVPAGSLDDEAIDEDGGIDSGAMLVYNPQFGVPSLIEYPSPPSIVYQMLDRLSSDMEYTAGVSQLMVVGSAPSGVTSGTAIDNLRQIDSTRMSLTADSIRNGVLSMARIWLRLNKEYSSGYRVLMIAGQDEAGGVYTWCADDINSYDIDYAAENELRHSKDQKRQDFIAALNAGLLLGDDGRIDKRFIETGLDLFDLKDTAAAYTEADLQRKNANRENSYLESGVVPERGLYDDDSIHIEEHIKYALGADYRQLMKRAPEYAKMFDKHIEDHRMNLRQQEEAARADAMQRAAEAQVMNQGDKNG
jgi:hypothetical protein|nr:MAG TPA_asm: portal [Caudoviricetes sp.]